MIKGLVGNIQHYSIHDGPGIRSTVFFKGCPLNCGWCHNPENLSFEPQLQWQKERCIACGDCADACLRQALRLEGEGVCIDEAGCTSCGTCAAVCPTLALTLVGRTMTVEEALTVLKKDALFYEGSGGGVTLSGGEPLGQAEFAAALLQALKREGIHTVMDTSGYAPWEQLAECSGYTDLFLYDIKHLDAARHKELTGVDNTLILANLQKLAERGADIWLRIPLLPGLNDAPEHIAAIGDMARELGIREVYLLPYHHLAQAKYEKLGLSYRMHDLAEPGSEQMEGLQKILLKKGLNAYVGG